MVGQVEERSPIMGQHVQRQWQGKACMAREEGYELGCKSVLCCDDPHSHTGEGRSYLVGWSVDYRAP